MTLRRFPWKAPRISDNSYRLFIAPPDPAQQAADSRKSSEQIKSSSNLAEANDNKQRAPSESGPAGRDDDTRSVASSHHHHHHHHHQSESKSDPPTSTNAPNQSSSDATNSSSTQASQTIKGPWRLLRLLPRESRHIIGRMLEIDPKKRATLEEIQEDKWVASAPVCRQEEGGRIVRQGNHEHTLEPGGQGTPAPSKK